MLINSVNINSLYAHQRLMDNNANNVANINTQDYKATNMNIVDNLQLSSYTSDEGVSLVKELTDQNVILYGFKAQIPVIETQDEMNKSVLDLKA